MEVNSKFQFIDINEKISKFTWRIENFSNIKDLELYSETFVVDGYNWRILIYPKGDFVDHLSIYLEVADSTTLPSGWSSYVQFGFAVIDQTDRKASITQAATYEFNKNRVCFGFSSLLPISELHNPKCGYLVNDACLVEAYFSTDRKKALISHDIIVETGSGIQKTEEADCVKSVLTNQETTITKPVHIKTLSLNQTSCQTVAIEPQEPSKEDMETFFDILESELSSLDIVYSLEETKEALVKLEEALNTTPINFYNSEKFSSLNQSFKILANFDCSSTTLTTEQKNELLAMEERLKELVDRAAKAVKDKDQLTAKKSIKLTLTRNLDRNRIRYKEVETKIKQVEQKLIAFHEQVAEAEKNRENILAEQKGIFIISKKMKMELEALGKEWTEYEANAKVAEEEEKTVEAEWGRMKDFISSIKGKI